MSNKGRLVILSAPSGTGKTTLVKRLLEIRPRFWHSISYTTRPKRLNETGGKDYHFVDVPTFQAMIENSQFAEWAQVHDCFYGTPKAPLEEKLKEGRDVLLDVDVQGGLSLKKTYASRAIAVFLLPPSSEELEKRLSSRGTDDLETCKKRLENAKKELEFQKHYDYRIVNDDLTHACEALLALLDKKL